MYQGVHGHLLGLSECAVGSQVMVQGFSLTPFYERRSIALPTARVGPRPDR